MWLVASLGVALRFLVKYAITKALLYMGFGFINYIGIDYLLDQIEVTVTDAYAGIPGFALDLAALAGLDVALTIMLSAIGMVIQIRALGTTGALLANIGRR